MTKMGTWYLSFRSVLRAGLWLLVAASLVFSACSRASKQPEKPPTPPEPRVAPLPPAKAEDTKHLFFERPRTRPGQTAIKVFKKDRTLELYGDGKIIGRFRIALGSAPEGDKSKEGDRRTPEGTYYICTRNDVSRYTLFLGISYPSIKDAENGLARGLINRNTHDRIKSLIEAQKQPPWNTPLGGAVGIHGGGTAIDWTFGCIALSDRDIRILWEYTPLKTPVEIYP